MTSRPSTCTHSLRGLRQVATVSRSPEPAGRLGRSSVVATEDSPQTGVQPLADQGATLRLEPVGSKRAAPLPEPLPDTASESPARFVVLQRWEGIVQEVEDDGFWARLDDLADVRPTEFVKLPLARVDDDDRELVVPGGVFYWTIGHPLDAPDALSGLLKFRTLPQWQPGDLERAKREGSALLRKLTAG